MAWALVMLCHPWWRRVLIAMLCGEAMTRGGYGRFPMCQFCGQAGHTQHDLQGQLPRPARRAATAASVRSAIWSFTKIRDR